VGWRNERKYDREVGAAAAQFPAIPPAVIKAVIAKESGFNPDARRGEPQLGDSSHGLMQLLLRTARELGFTGTVAQLYLPLNNIYLGTKLLNELWAQLGNWPGVYSAYNGGVRPALGFGSPATRPLRICLARDANGDCTTWRDVKPGEYSNQPYVDKVAEYRRYFEHGGSTGAGTVGSAAVFLVALGLLRFLHA
jgi:soluble lytic murein transglycosylase-like protein